MPNLARVVELLQQNRANLGQYLTKDPKGSLVIDYLKDLTALLAKEHAEALRENHSIREKLEHLNQIVAAQQRSANATGFVEIIPPAELIEYALRLCDGSLERAHIRVVREFMPAPPVKVQRQRALQILVNLLNNARDALAAKPENDRQITLRVTTSAETERVQIAVVDNGCGVPPEIVTKIFAFGFTTKKNGHGFGLHSSALAAREMEGSLQVEPSGPSLGATFVLELPAGGAKPARDQGAVVVEIQGRTPSIPLADA